MPQFSRNLTYSIVCALAFSWWGILHGQTVPTGAGDTGTVPIRISPRTAVEDSLSRSLQLDSLEIEMLRIEIAKAEETVSSTIFWNRITPQIHFSGSFGMHDLMFIDPTSYTPYILPRDAYRMTVSLSLNEVLTSPRHTQAILDLHKLRMELSLRRIQQLNSRKLLEQQLLDLQDQAALVEREISYTEELLHFNELRFQQGKIEFDALTRSKLELSAAMRSLLQLHHQEVLIRLKLSH
jgi:outer membrane protein TolC